MADEKDPKTAVLDEPEVTDDDPNAPDDEGEEFPGADKIRSGRLASDSDEDEDDEEEGETEEGGEEAPEATQTTETTGTPEPEDKGGEPPEKPGEEKPPEKVFTQTDVERIVQERLSRDRKAQAVRELEARTGKTVDQLLAEQREARKQELALEKGMSEEDAEHYLTMEEENRLLKAQQQEAEERKREYERMAEYTRQRTVYESSPDIPADLKPFVREYLTQIDEFADHGRKNLDFSVAATFVLGQNVPKIIAKLNADWQKKLDAKEQEVLRNVQRRGEVKPAEAAAGGAEPGPVLSQREKRAAALLGISEKAYAKQKQRTGR